jgi:hypothetical protein
VRWRALTLGGISCFGAEGEPVAIKGTRSSRKAAGTLKISDFPGTQESEIVGGPKRHLGTCTSGTLHWSASRG